MPLFTGRRVEVGVGKESTRGTPIAVAKWLPKTDITFDDKIEKANVAGSYGNITDSFMTGQVTQRYAEGDIEGELNANSFGYFLYALCGTISTSGPTDDAYTHDFTLQNDNQHDTLTVYVKDPIGTMRYAMAMLNSLSIDISANELVTYTANFISKYHQTATDESPTYEIDHRFVAPNLTFKVADAIDDLGDAASICVKNLSLTFEKNVERLDCITTLEPEDILNKGLKITGTLELNYEDRTWRDYMLNGSVKAMQIDLVGSKLIGATTYPELDIVFPKVHFESWEPARGLDDVASQTLDFDVYFDLSNTRLWSTFQLVNTQTSY